VAFVVALFIMSVYMRCINRYMYTIYYAMPATDLINWSTSHCIPTFDLGSSVEHARPERHPVIINIVVVAPIQFIMVPSARTTGPQQPVLFSIVIRGVHYMLCKLSGPTPPMIFDLYTIAVYLPATRQKLDQCCSSDPPYCIVMQILLFRRTCQYDNICLSGPVPASGVLWSLICYTYTVYRDRPLASFYIIDAGFAFIAITTRSTPRVIIFIGVWFMHQNWTTATCSIIRTIVYAWYYELHI